MFQCETTENKEQIHTGHLSKNAYTSHFINFINFIPKAA